MNDKDINEIKEDLKYINAETAKRAGVITRGQVINELVAKKLTKDCICLVPEIHVKDYCHSIEAAWEIVEHLTGFRELRMPSKITMAFLNLKGWQVIIDSVCVISDTAPMAICLAFLKLTDEKEPK